MHILHTVWSLQAAGLHHLYSESSHRISSSALVFSYKAMAGAPFVVVAHQPGFVLGCLLPYPHAPAGPPYSPCKEKDRQFRMLSTSSRLYSSTPLPSSCQNPLYSSILPPLNALFDQKASRRPSQFTLWSIGRARALTGHCTIHHIGWRVSSFCWSPGRSRTSLKSQGGHVRQQKSQSQSLPLRSCS